jgi:hypothetical protein
LQMSMYFAPAFFGHLLGKCLKRKYPIVEIMKLGFVVLGTFALVWWPYLHSYEAAIQVMNTWTLWLFHHWKNHNLYWINVAPQISRDVFTELVYLSNWKLLYV